MFKSKKLAVLAALLSLLMLLSLTAVPAFAEEAGTTAETQTVVETGTGEADTNTDTEAVTGEAVTGEASTGAETGSETGTEAGTGAGTEAETKKETETTGSNGDGKKDDNTGLIRALINLGVGVVILVVLGILAYKFRAKIPGWWKGLKSECGKITWCPKDKLKKNTLVVVVIILAIAAAIGVLDFVFSRGMILLGELIH